MYQSHPHCAQCLSVNGRLCWQLYMLVWLGDGDWQHVCMRTHTNNHYPSVNKASKPNACRVIQWTSSALTGTWLKMETFNMKNQRPPPPLPPVLPPSLLKSRPRGSCQSLLLQPRHTHTVVLVVRLSRKMPPKHNTHTDRRHTSCTVAEEEDTHRK